MIGGAMDLVVTGVVAGVLGTLVMDSLNHLFSRTGMILKIDVAMIGRMSAGWTRGRFRYRHPGEMEPVAKELLYGYITHYAIGVGFAVIYMLGWDLVVGGPASPVWALVYGFATTVASHFFVSLPWDWVCVAGGLPKALKALSPPWPTTYSMEWVLRSGSHCYEYWGKHNAQGGLCAT